MLGSCSVARKAESLKLFDSKLPSDQLFDDVRNRNITNYGFFVEKAEIKVSDRDGTKRLLASVKYMESQEYLISLRGTGGIEAARIFISKDSALINDRINKVTYFGNLKSVEKRYGVNLAVLPLLLGDFIVSEKTLKARSECEEGVVSVTDNIGGLKVDYLINCKERKAVLTRLEKSTGITGWELLFDGFSGKGDRTIPENITINDKTTGNVIEIRIMKLTIPWTGEIKFIPGSRYEKVELR